jgi:hypothetical protein
VGHPANSDSTIIAANVQRYDRTALSDGRGWTLEIKKIEMQAKIVDRGQVRSPISKFVW